MCGRDARSGRPPGVDHRARRRHDGSARGVPHPTSSPPTRSPRVAARAGAASRRRPPVPPHPGCPPPRHPGRGAPRRPRPRRGRPACCSTGATPGLATRWSTFAVHPVSRPVRPRSPGRCRSPAAWARRTIRVSLRAAAPEPPTPAGVVAAPPPRAPAARVPRTRNGAMVYIDLLTRSPPVVGAQPARRTRAVGAQCGRGPFPFAPQRRRLGAWPTNCSTKS